MLDQLIDIYPLWYTPLMSNLIFAVSMVSVLIYSVIVLSYFVYHYVMRRTPVKDEFLIACHHLDRLILPKNLHETPVYYAQITHIFRQYMYAVDPCMSEGYTEQEMVEHIVYHAYLDNTLNSELHSVLQRASHAKYVPINGKFFSYEMYMHDKELIKTLIITTKNALQKNVQQ